VTFQTLLERRPVVARPKRAFGALRNSRRFPGSAPANGSAPSVGEVEQLQGRQIPRCAEPVIEPAPVGPSNRLSVELSSVRTESLFNGCAFPMKELNMRESPAGVYLEDVPERQTAPASSVKESVAAQVIGASGNAP